MVTVTKTKKKKVGTKKPARKPLFAMASGETYNLVVREDRPGRFCWTVETSQDCFAGDLDEHGTARSASEAFDTAVRTLMGYHGIG